MPISLAPLRYQRVFAETGGPIARLQLLEKEPQTVGGQHRANAYLRPELRPSWLRSPRFYADGDGSGTHRVQNTACHIAISEALERWAFYAEAKGANRERFAFQHEPSTTGMAAFPGIGKSAARTRAVREAVERWSIVEWWIGRLPAQPVHGANTTEGLLQIKVPFRQSVVAIVWSPCSFGGLAFGFAAEATLSAAAHHASVERARNVVALERLYREMAMHPDVFPLDTLTLESERRLVFFASTAGTALFHEKLKRSTRLTSLPDAPKTLVDCEIPGEWSQYATVWRTLYEPTTDQHLDSRKNDFFSF